ncbi:MAG: hypothetical protein KG012_04695 [Deltaproteobacteria bacterium]|nr:hypothetical protein [Deltaproteobacteria bacterium]
MNSVVPLHTEQGSTLFPLFAAELLSETKRLTKHLAALKPLSFQLLRPLAQQRLRYPVPPLKLLFTAANRTLSLSFSSLPHASKTARFATFPWKSALHHSPLNLVITYV